MKHALLTAIVLAFASPAFAADDCALYASARGDTLTWFKGGEIAANDAHGQGIFTCGLAETPDPKVFDAFCDFNKGQVVFNTTEDAFTFLGVEWRKACPTRV